MKVDLVLPDRTTVDYVGPSVEPRVQEALEKALQEEEDIELAPQ